MARKVQGRGMASTHQRAVAYDGLGALADEPLESDAWTAEKGLHIILQHRRLLELLRSIEDSVASEELGGWRGAAEPLLEEFIELLGNHFAAEVATTFPDLRAQGNPAYAERLARLDAEHPMLVQQFESVMRMLLDPRATRQEVQGALGGAADAFRRHEACENALFLDQS